MRALAVTLLLALIGALLLFIWRANRRISELRARHARRRAARQHTHAAPAPVQFRSRSASQPVADRFFAEARASPFDALAHLRNGDVDGARRALQKIAYGMMRASPQERAAFTALMVRFTTLDPLYAQGLAAALPVVTAQPGIRQTALYPHMAMTVEEARYVLYFAAERGHIQRHKHGNSYSVYPPK